MPSSGYQVEVAAVRGVCHAGFREGDRLCLEGLGLPEGSEPSCRVAFASIVANIGRLKLQEGPLYVSCPDPATGAGGNVVFKLSLVGDDEDCHHQAGRDLWPLPRWPDPGR